MPSLADMKVVRTLVTRAEITGTDQVAAGLNKISTAQDKVTQSSEAMARVTDTSARRQLSVSGAYDREMRRLDARYAMERKLESSTRTIDRAYAQGTISLSEHSRAMELATTKYRGIAIANDNLGKTSQVASHHITNLNYQISDIATSLAGGASPFQVMSQQAGQVLPILAETGIGGALKGIGARLTSLVPLGVGVFGGLAAGIGSVAYAYSRYEEQTREGQRSLMGIGRGSGLTPEQLRIASGEKEAGTRGYSPGVGGLSLANSRELATGIGGTGYGSIEGIRQAAGMVKDLSATLGESQADVSKSMVDLFRDPSRQLDEWNKRLGFSTGSLRDHVRALQEEGANGKAAQEVLAAMLPTLGKYSDMTPLSSRATDQLTKSFSDFISMFERGSKVLIDGPEAMKRTGDAAKAATDRIAEQTRRIRDVAELATIGMSRENTLARRDPLSQAIYGAQAKAGVAPPMTVRDLDAQAGLSQEQFAERERQAAIVRRLVVQRNDLELRKSLTEQSRVNALTFATETAAIGLNVRESERLRFEMQARIAAGQGGKAVSEAIEAQIRKEAAAYGQLAEALARARVADQLRFDRAQLGRSQDDQAIAGQLRSAGLGDIEDPANAAAVSTMRLNQTLTDTKATASESLKGFISDLRAGKTGAEALSNALNRIGDRLLDKALDSALSGLFGLGSSKGTTSPLAAIAEKATSGIANVGAWPVGKVDTAPLGLPGAAATGDMGIFAKAIKAIESGGGVFGRENYGALGPITKTGDRAYGAYQVMGANVPSWTKSALGREMTPADFLKDKAAQDAVFNDKFGGYVDRFGPAGASQAWLGGPVSVGKLGRADVNGTTVGGYSSTFDRLVSQNSRPSQDSMPDWDAASKSFRSSTDEAATSLGDLTGRLDDMPSSANSFTSSLEQLGARLSQASFGGSEGGGFKLPGLGGLFSGGNGGAADATFADGAGVFGFADGGYTGAGGKYQPAGVVHAGEFVFSQAAVGRLGLGYLDGLHRGYADGGMVGLPAGMTPVPVNVPMMPANTNGSGNAPHVSVNISNTDSGRTQVTAQQNKRTGDIDVQVRALEDKLAQRMADGQGALNQARGGFNPAYGKG